MSNVQLRQALEVKLAAMVPNLSTAFENATFEPPAPDVPWQEVNLIPATPDNAVLANNYYREHGIFQVSLMYPLLTGSADAAARAAVMQTTFYRGLVLTKSGVIVTIETTPAIGPGFRDRDRWRVPVSVRYRAEITS